jgi:ATP-dependent helicase HrpB
MAAALDAEDLRRDHAPFIHLETRGNWDDTAGRLRVITSETLGALVLSSSESASADPDTVRVALTDAIARSRLALLNWTDGATRLQQRVAFLRVHDASWPDLSTDALVATMDSWLAPSLFDVRTAGEVAKLDLRLLLQHILSPRQRSELDRLAPEHFVAPTGSRLSIDYSDATAPSFAVRLQELFGCGDHPSVLGGRVALTIQLLSPAHRPVQVTRDLPGFWRGSYHDVRKDLRGRYPKHEWPEDPMTAKPTRRAKPRPG